MPDYPSFPPAAPLPSVCSLREWLRATYQAPFQRLPSTLSISEQERLRRAALLRVTTFTITLIIACVGLSAAVIFQGGAISISAILFVSVMGVVSLWLNERGRTTMASLLYWYSFLVCLYVFILSAPVGFNAQTLITYALINAILLLGGLVLPERIILFNGILVILLSSLLVVSTPPNRAPVLESAGSLTSIAAYLDIFYLLTTALAWLTARSYRANLTRLAETLEQEQQLVALKDLFIVSANHELRTPIMTLSNNLELVSRTLDQVSPQERQEMVERALRASNELQSLLSSVLNGGVSEAEVRKHLHMEVLSVRSIVQQALDTFDPRELGEPWLEQTTLQSRPVSLDIAPDLAVLADSGRTRQVLVNLLSNALKYSDATAPLAISARQVKGTGQRAAGTPHIPAGSWIQINVRDWGLGIPPQEQPLLFLRFVRLARDAASATRGTGVGLYLCRTLVQAMGGHIWVESTGIPGKGSVFSFILPAMPDPAA